MIMSEQTKDTAHCEESASRISINVKRISSIDRKLLAMRFYKAVKDSTENPQLKEHLMSLIGGKHEED